MKNSLKTPILGVQGRWRSSMLVPSESSSAVLFSPTECCCCYARWIGLPQKIGFKYKPNSNFINK